VRTLLEAWRAHTPHELTVAAAIALGVLVALAILRFGASRVSGALAERSTAPFHRVARDTVDATRLWLLFPVALYVGGSALRLSEKVEHVIGLTAAIALMLQAAAWGNRFIQRWFEEKTAHPARGDGETVTALALISFVSRVMMWVIVVLVILNHLGVNITALVAGLGIGGVAVALALQNVLGDLLASLAIVLDKPFVVGDTIMVGDVSGQVERVGIKTTRLRSVNGELLVVSNAELLKTRIHNYRQMTERRVLFGLGIAYETPQDKLERLPEMLREIVMAQKRVRFDRAHFKGYGESALLLEVVYYVLDRDYNLYMDVQQAINLEINRRFQAEGIEFATRTVYIREEPAPGKPENPPSPVPGP
jgi:small-conductance mechanosensitive channel